VGIGPGGLTKESVHLEEKQLTGWEKYEGIPSLVQIAKNKVWVSFLLSANIWIGKIKRKTISMKLRAAHFSPIKCIGVLPIQPPGGKFLAVTERWPVSTAITVVTPGRRFSFQDIGDLPYGKRACVSMISIGERFIMGTGRLSDTPTNNMSVFDLQTRRQSPLEEDGEQRIGASGPFLAVRDQSIYVIGGTNTTVARSLSFTTLSRLILSSPVRVAFCQWFGISFQPRVMWKRKQLGGDTANYL